MFELGIVLLLVLFVFFIYITKTKKKKLSKGELKGIEGEKRVNEVLDGLGITYFHDVLLKDGNVSNQIDQICVFRNKVIVVIETKNKDGAFYGAADEDKWLQVIGNNKHYFYNPIKQNEGHINFLSRMMSKHKLYGYKVFSLVVFASKRSTLNDVPSGVIHLNELPQILIPLKKKTLFNRSKKFVRMLVKEDRSRNRKEVERHKEFAKNARYYKK